MLLDLFSQHHTLFLFCHVFFFNFSSKNPMISKQMYATWFKQKVRYIDATVQPEHKKKLMCQKNWQHFNLSKCACSLFNKKKDTSPKNNAWIFRLHSDMSLLGNRISWSTYSQFWSHLWWVFFSFFCLCSVVAVIKPEEVCRPIFQFQKNFCSAMERKKYSKYRYDLKKFKCLLNQVNCDFANSNVILLIIMHNSLCRCMGDRQIDSSWIIDKGHVTCWHHLTGILWIESTTSQYICMPGFCFKFVRTALSNSKAGKVRILYALYVVF